MEYYSAFKRNEILAYATIWMNLEIMMMSERSRTQKDKYYMVPLVWVHRVGQTHKDRK